MRSNKSWYTLKSEGGWVVIDFSVQNRADNYGDLFSLTVDTRAVKGLLP